MALIVIVSLVNLMLIGIPAFAGDDDRKLEKKERKLLEPQDHYKVRIKTDDGTVNYDWEILELVGFIMFWVSKDPDSYESDFIHIAYDVGMMADSFFCQEEEEYYFIWKNTQESGSYNITYNIYYPEYGSQNAFCGLTSTMIGTFGLIALLILIKRK
jgi:hypothetical protein